MWNNKNSTPKPGKSSKLNLNNISDSLNGLELNDVNNKSDLEQMNFFMKVLNEKSQNILKNNIQRISDDVQGSSSQNENIFSKLGFKISQENASSLINLNEEDTQNKSGLSYPLEFDTLVNDQYYPGVIHDSIFNNLDFNELGQSPLIVNAAEKLPNSTSSEKGLSLLEAFDMRFKNVEKEFKKKFSTKGNNMKISNTMNGLNSIASSIVLEDTTRFSTTALDIESFLCDKPNSELMKAITCLLRAEQINDYQRKVRAAERAANQAPPEFVEDAAIQGAQSFRVENSTTKTTEIPGNKNYKPLEIVSYIGITRPADSNK